MASLAVTQLGSTPRRILESDAMARLAGMLAKGKASSSSAAAAPFRFLLVDWRRGSSIMASSSVPSIRPRLMDLPIDLATSSSMPHTHRRAMWAVRLVFSVTSMVEIREDRPSTTAGVRLPAQRRMAEPMRWHSICWALSSLSTASTCFCSKCDKASVRTDPEKASVRKVLHSSLSASRREGPIDSQRQQIVSAMAAMSLVLEALSFFSPTVPSSSSSALPSSRPRFLLFLFFLALDVAAADSLTSESMAALRHFRSMAASLATEPMLR
mmetsp:Transcript_3092/g.7090  ORF Transcript_3092/g.7090 Transcript_3092/m.7090 type:complete len:269 (-) Transcript_3092:135-941(-)